MNYAGQWTNCIKLHPDAVRRALDERDLMRKEKRDGAIVKEGAHLLDMVRRFSVLIRTWYPKSK
jgi:hypothetical protein